MHYKWFHNIHIQSLPLPSGDDKPCWVKWVLEVTNLVRDMKRMCKVLLRKIRCDHTSRRSELFLKKRKQFFDVYIRGRTLSASNLWLVQDPVSNCDTTDPQRVKQIAEDYLRDMFSRKCDPKSQDIPFLLDMYKPLSSVSVNIWDNFLRPVSPVDVWKLISSLPSKTSPGWDMVDHDMLRIACQPSQHCRVSFVLRMITKLTNRCIGNSFFPRYGKKGVTIMIPKKKKNATSVYNMRPITMFPIVTNLIVRIITERFVSLIQEHGLLHVNNRGFIKGGNTAQCIDTVLDLIEECWDSNLLHMVKLDIRKAYSSFSMCVWHFNVCARLQRLFSYF